MANVINKIAGFPTLDDFYRVEDYGAIGDGTTIDTDAILAAIEAAGANGSVLFTPNSTYLIDRALDPNDAGGSTNVGQTWFGYGAILKRIDETTPANGVVTSDSGTITATDTTVTVTDSSEFRVGMTVSAYEDATTYSTVNSKITDITGNVLTVTPGFDTTLTSATVISSMNMISTFLDDTTILGLEFDGNRDNNTNFAHWDTNNAVILAGNRCLARDLYAHDEVGEGIQVGRSDSVVESSRFINIGGNGIHLTGGRCNQPKVINNTVKWTQLSGANVGHVEGGIIWSENIRDAIVMGNYVEGSVYAFGTITINNGKGAVISGNTIRNCTSVIGIFNIGGADTPTSATLGAGDLTSTGFVATISNTDIVTDIGFTLANAVGKKLLITGSLQSEYNGTFEIVAAPDADTITFRFAHNGDGSSTSPATGTIVVTGVDSNPTDVIFTDNMCYNCGEMLIKNDSTFDDTYGVKNITINGNFFYNCFATVESMHNIIFKSNTWIYDDDKSVAVASRTQDVISFVNCTEVIFDDYVEGGRYGVSITGSSAKNIKISGVFRNNNKYGVFFGHTFSANNQVGVIGAQISTDTVGSAYIDTNRYACIRARNGMYIKECIFDNIYGATAGFLGGNIFCNGGTAGAAIVISGNVVRSTNKSFLLLDSSCDNVIVKGNFIPTTTQDDYIEPLAGGTGYTASDVLTVGGGTGTAATITVIAVSSGVITQAEITTHGVYSVYPSNPVSVTGGTGGDDATFNIPTIYEDNLLVN